MVVINPFTFFTQMPKLPLLWQPSVYYIYETISIFLFVYLFILLFSFHIQVKSYGLILLSIIPSRSIHAVTNGKISFFNGWVIFYCIYVQFLLIYLFICLFNCCSSTDPFTISSLANHLSMGLGLLPNVAIVNYATKT